MFNPSRTLRLTRSVAAMLVLGSVVLLSAGWAGAAPPPPAKFWTVSHCRAVLHAHDYLLPTANGHGFHVGERVCCRHGRTARLSVDARPPFPPLLQVQGLHALS